MLLFFYVMRQLQRMIMSALDANADDDARRGLRFVLYATLVIWSSFPICWIGLVSGLMSIQSAECTTMISNFMAKASSAD